MTARWRRHIVVGHFVRSDTSHVMQAIDVTRQSRITQQLVPSTTVLSFVCCSQFACKKKLLMTFGTTLVCTYIYIYACVCVCVCMYIYTYIYLLTELSMKLQRNFKETSNSIPIQLSPNELQDMNSVTN